jgi:hypothetical protein
MLDINQVAAEKTPVYVVTGLYAKRYRPLRVGLERLRNRLKLLGVFSLNPKDIRILDDLTPDEARRFRERPDDTYELGVYLLQPADELGL